MLAPNQQVPERLELLPAARVGDVAYAAPPIVLGGRAAEDGTPSVEVPIRPPVTVLQLAGQQPGRFEDHMPRVVQVPITVQQSVLGFHATVQSSVWVRGEDVERRRLDSLRDRP